MKLSAIADLARIQAEKERRRRLRLYRYYQDEGPLRRELYQKHLAFFRAGAAHEPMAPWCRSACSCEKPCSDLAACPTVCHGEGHRQRCMMAANRVGKSEGVGAYETTLHLTGLYPDWWEGRRFTHGIKCWAAGDTSKTVRDIVQQKLLGEPGQIGTGMIPGDKIMHRTAKPGVPDAIDTVWVQHTSGDLSYLVLKSYDQRRESFQGTEQHLIWLDEEAPEDIYAECLMRTMTTNGLVMLTFTPLLGLSQVVLSYLPGGHIPTSAAV